MRSSVAVMLAVTTLATGSMAVARSASGADAYAAEMGLLTVADAAPPAPGGCENGEERDDTGACPLVEGSDSKSRGFTLFSGSMNRPQGPAPQAAPTPAAKAVAQVRPASAAVGDTFKCGVACDLKVNFRPGSTALTADSEARLAKFAESLRDPTLARKRFEIGGHTDASGGAEKNRGLSQSRAEAVRAFLVAHGVPSSRLEAKGYGAEGLAFPGQPLDPRNRRVEARALN